MKSRSGAEVIVLADYEHQRRKRSGASSGPMGVVLSLDACRARRTEAGRRDAPKPARKSAFETRAPRGR